METDKQYRSVKLTVWLTERERNDVRDAAHDDPESDNVSDWIRGLIRHALVIRSKPGPMALKAQAGGKE
jgi:hypothetical protein